MAKTKIRSLTEKEVTFRIEAEYEDVSVRGAFASGDDAADKEDEDAIIARLEQGDVWAWASVRVIASWRGYEGSDSLGCCSYADEDDFKSPGGYYDDMKQRALDELNSELHGHASVLSELRFNPEGKVWRPKTLPTTEKPPRGFVLHTESQLYVKRGYTLQKCTGEAHNNPHIDHCMVCLGQAWGWTVEKLPD